MALEGSIKDFGIADIFQLINLQKKSGVLTIQNGEAVASINFSVGEIVYAVSTKMGENEKVGRLLIGLGKLSEKALEDALIVQQNTGGKIGHILTASGAISEDDLKDVLQIQIKDVIFQAFRWKNGWYKFDAQEIEYEKEYQIPIPTDFILMEGIRMLDEWPYIESHISSENIIFSQSLKGEEAESLFSSLTPEEMSVFNLIDGQRDIRMIKQLVNLTEFDVFKNIAALKVAGLIEEITSTPPLNLLPQGEGELRSSSDESNMSGALTKVDENGWDKNVPPIHNISLDRRGFPTPPEGFDVPLHEEKNEKRRIWTAVQIAILIFIVSSIFIFFSIREIAGIKDYSSAYDRLKKSSAVDEMTSLRNAITFYQKANGKLSESLESLYQEHFISEDIITDPWGNKFVFEPLPQGYSIYSKGPDGLSGSSDDIK
ncbi:MAG: DUF4388 domain-containing protein [Nitrospirae bacterium]|nr:DUF4388 domain-containing protein [Nitrospirota bacterium]